jgi:hypothetical protein
MILEAVMLYVKDDLETSFEDSFKQAFQSYFIY